MTDDAWTRDEHLAWAKQRALEYLDRRDVQNAVTSIMSDLGKHSELRRSADAAGAFAIAVMMRGSVQDARRFIEGFR